MSTKRALVVYYSRTGHTRAVAEALAAAMGADLEELRNPTDREGIFGFLRSGTEALLEASTEIASPGRDPGAYELVVVGGPVWAFSVSSPVRTYLWLERERIARVAFFATYGGMGADHTFDQMTLLAGRFPLGKLALREADLEAGAHAARVASFAKDLLAQLPVPAITPA